MVSLWGDLLAALFIQNPVLPVDHKCIVRHRLEMIQAEEEEIHSGDKGDLGL